MLAGPVDSPLWSAAKKGKIHFSFFYLVSFDIKKEHGVRNIYRKIVLVIMCHLFILNKKI
jgi:hypothetical protein